MNRRVWVVCLSALLVLAPAFYAWGGGPVASDRDAARPDSSRSQQSPQQQQSSTPSGADAGAQAGGFSPSATGGLGLGGIGGNIGASPQVNMATTSERKWSWYGGIGYPIQIREDVVLALGADAILQKFEGNNVTYDGAGPVWGSSGPHPGELIDSKLEMNLYRVNGDVLWGSTLSGGSASLYMGPRFQYVRYADKFSITPTNSYASWSEDSRIRNYNMYGFGVAGQLPLGNLSGRSASGCDAGGSGLMSILPKLRGAYTLGWGNGMRYQAVEGFVEVKVGHDKLSFNLGGAAFNPGLLFQAGFIYMHVTETTENKVNAGLTGTSDAGYTDRADYWLKYPVLQATIAF